MGRKRTPGLYKRYGNWHIDKQVFGRRICESTGASELEEAERYLAKRVEGIRQAIVYGVRPKREFREAATKYLLENKHKASIREDARCLRELDQYIGDMSLETVHMGSIQSFIEARKKEGVKIRTINYALQVLRHLLNLAAGEWLDDHGLTWLAAAPKIKLLREHDRRQPYPLNWDEQKRLFDELPEHLRIMALFAVNTGCREAEVCNLRWSWEIKTEIENRTVFIIPAELVKNREDRLVVLNNTAQRVIESVRGKHPEFVFTLKDQPLKRMHGTAWRSARKRADLKQFRVHDLKHTFGRRLRSAGVNFEDRQDLLGHKSGRITTHYSAAELNKLIEAANKVCEEQDSGVTITVLRQAYGQHH